MDKDKQDKYNYPPEFEKLPLHVQRIIELHRVRDGDSREEIAKRIGIATELDCGKNIFERSPNWEADS